MPGLPSSDQSSALLTRRSFLKTAGAALLAAPSIYAARSLLGQESVYANGFNMYGSRGFMRVLMIGDSLSVGGFGEGMAEYLVSKFGRASVAVYASCGSAPQHWLRSEPDYQTHCGYREVTPRTNILNEHRGMITPKIEDLISILHPRTVIVQQGTNWMDGWGSDTTHYGEILYRFISAIHSEAGTVRQIIWVSPPDHTHYSKGVQQSVLNLIQAGGHKYGYTVIDSSRLTHYTPGRTGSDGVHYNSEEGRVWATNVIREMGPMLGR